MINKLLNITLLAFFWMISPLSYAQSDTTFIKTDNLTIDVSKLMESFFEYDENHDTLYLTRIIQTTIYVPIQNITNQMITCNKEMTMWNDCGADKYNGISVEIQPNTTYQMPIHLNMWHKCGFSRTGMLHVSNGKKEMIHYLKVYSNFFPKGKVKWTDSYKPIFPPKTSQHSTN